MALAGMLAISATAQAQPAPGLALAQQQNCMSCHSVKRHHRR
jgi:cytochrome c